MPKEILPENIYSEFNRGDATLMAVFFDSSTSADETMDAIRQIRALAGKQCFVTGMSALVTDLKDLCEKEEPIYVALAVACACAAMMLLLDSWLAPFIFLAGIGLSILLNMGTNYFFGEISYITKALSAVLQLAVTMDYSIFLWHSYNEQLAKLSEPGGGHGPGHPRNLRFRAGQLHHHHRGLCRPVLHELHHGPRSGPGDGQGRAAGRDRVRHGAARADSHFR